MIDEVAARAGTAKTSLGGLAFLLYNARVLVSSLAIGVDRSEGPFRGFLPRKTTPRDLFQSTVIAKLL
jgi:hypothetical protein